MDYIAEQSFFRGTTLWYFDFFNAIIKQAKRNEKPLV